MRNSYTHSVRMNRQLCANFKAFVTARGMKVGWATEQAVVQWLKRAGMADPYAADALKGSVLNETLGPSSGAAPDADGSGRAGGSDVPESPPPARCAMPRVAGSVAGPTMPRTGHADAERQSGELAEVSSCG
jgi:hypothetical protein